METFLYNYGPSAAWDTFTEVLAACNAPDRKIGQVQNGVFG